MCVAPAGSRPVGADSSESPNMPYEPQITTTTPANTAPDVSVAPILDGRPFPKGFCPNPNGRPPIYTIDTIDELRSRLCKWMVKVSRGDKKPTIVGLALDLGFHCKETLYQYAKNPVFTDLIKEGMAVVEEAHELRMYEQGCVGSIFVLKNMGWTDRQETEISGGLNIIRAELPAKVPVGSPLE
jgi:hypothetical protein